VVDLHTHTTVSDGTDTPERLLELAEEAGISHLSITDHERVDAYSRIGTPKGIELIGGCEIPAVDHGTGATVHVLVYFPLARLEAARAALEGFAERRRVRNLEILERLRGLGIELSEEELLSEATEEHVGRPHIARAMAKKGVVASVQEAFDRYIGEGGPAYVPDGKIGLAEAVELAGRAKGVCVLAHPLRGSGGLEEVEALVRRTREAGFVGIEAYYGDYPPETRTALAELAERLGLVPTAGSDYHGANKPRIQLGTGRGDLCAGPEVAERLKAVLGTP
jgi:predicted metal-dependent phosphoesterase TrpH